MTWLSGFPSKARRIQWPHEMLDFRFKASLTVQRFAGSSILDDRLCHFMSYRSENTAKEETELYYADLTNTGDVVHAEKVATLLQYLLAIELLPRDSPTNALFVSVEFDESNSSIILRAHGSDGSVLKHQSISAKAPFGQLTVNGDRVGICIGTGNLPDFEQEYFLSDASFYSRMDYIADFSQPCPDLIPDSIVVWNISEDSITLTEIPQLEDAPMLHSGQFQFVSNDIIGLAGCVETSVYDHDAALLKMFSLKEAFERTFTHGQHPERECIRYFVGKPGSSAPSEIFLHHHDDDNGGRLTVFRREILDGRSEALRETAMCEGLWPAYEQLSSQRTVRGRVNLSLPSVAGNRLLINDSTTSSNPKLVILDFDASRIHNLLELDTAGRQHLGSHLGDLGANVKVVTRRSYLFAGGEEHDAEYPTPETAKLHADWFEHIKRLKERDQDRYENGNDVSGLEFDEAPEENRDKAQFGFVASVVQLPPDVPQSEMALTSSAIIQVPEAFFEEWDTWRVFDFTDVELDSQ